MRELVAAVHIDGISISVALVDSSGELVAARETSASREVPTPARRGGDAIVAQVNALIARARSLAPSGRYVVAVGVGTEGVIDERGRIVSAPKHFHEYAETELVSGISEASGLPVRAANDVHTYALGEAWRGAMAGASTAIFVGIGAGVWGSVLTYGRPWRGAHNVAGHLGHAPSPRAMDLVCSCGQSGHLESIGSGPAIAEAYDRRTGRRLPTGQSVIFAAARGEADAVAVVNEAAAAVGLAVGGLANVLDTETVVLGGPVVDAGASWWVPMEAELRQTLVPEQKDLLVRPALLGPEAALVGAARLAWLEFDKTMRREFASASATAYGRPALAGALTVGHGWD